MSSSTSAADKQKLLLQQEIAKLSGAISRHATSSSSSRPAPSYHPYARGRGSSRGAYSRGRGSASRGRGRGGYSLDLRGVNKPSTLSSATSAPSASTSEQSKEAGEIEATPPAGPSQPSGPTVDWVKTSNSGNMSLMTAETKAKLAARPKPVKKRRLPAHVQVLSSSSTGQGPKQVVIDGVIFQFEQDGKKLTRVGEQSPTSSQNTPTRKKLDYGGHKYRRTSRGNLVQSKAKIPCRYYTKTGRCNRALSCPYAHIPDRLAICPKFLRGTCPFTADTCPLSHRPSAHNTPSCVHFQATSTCRNGPGCLYPHVRVAPDAPICDAFARGGWCDEEPGTCAKLHVWECGEYRDKGTCSRGGKCGLRHVLKAEKGKLPITTATPTTNTTATGATEDVVMGTVGTHGPAGSFEDNTDFVNLDQGSPPEISEEEQSDDDHEDSDDDDDDDDDENDNNDSDDSSAEESGESGDDSEQDAERVLGVVA